MGLFKSKKSKGAPGEVDNHGSPTRKKFPFLKPRKQPPQPAEIRPAATKASTVGEQAIRQQQQRQHQEQIEQRDSHKDTPNENVEEDDDLGDIPRSISTPSRDDDQALPPLPLTPGKEEGQSKEGEKNEEDSIGSPCESMRKSQQAQQQQQAADNEDTEKEGGEQPGDAIQRAAIAHRLQKVAQQAPSLDHLRHYVAALSPEVSPDPSAELPSRALRCLFSLSEHSSHKQQRIDMVRGAVPKKEAESGTDDSDESESDDESDDEQPVPLVPALLSFLKRTPRDSSEQYLTLLVLNNLSIPAENKRPIALEHGAAKTLGRLLCEDPGCHLLVIIIVNLTFGDEGLNRDLLTMSASSNQRKKDEGTGGEERSFVSCGGEVQLVDSLAYALLLASLTAEELSALGPIPLTSPEGIHHAPRNLLSLLFSLLESKLGIRYRKNGALGPPDAISHDELYDAPLSLGGDDCPFPETARWCLGAIKNLTRPGRLSPSSVSSEEEELGVSNEEGSAVAAHAVLDAGILPLLLRILKCKEGDTDGSSTSSGVLYGWQSNSAQDAALYALMHMASVPQMKRALRDDYDGRVLEALNGVLNYGRVIGDRLVKYAVGGGGDEEDELGYTSLQSLKARLALSYILLGSENNDDNNGDGSRSKYALATVLAEHETYSLLELLSNCLNSRSKDGPGGYSAATFSLKGVLFGVRCILSRKENCKVFALADGNGWKLNALLLKALSRHALMSDATADVIDSEAAEHAAVSLYRMTLCGLDRKEIGFKSPFGKSIFLPESFGTRGKTKAKSAVANVLKIYMDKDVTTLRGWYIANQILFRLNYLRFEDSAADLSKPGTLFPSKTDLDLDDKVIAALKEISPDESCTKGAKPKEYIFKRAVAQREKEGGSVLKAISGGKSRGNSRVFSNALHAAEELAWANSFARRMETKPLDVFGVANDISYYADGLDVYHGFTWKWDDGNGDLIERIYSAAETEDEMLAPGSEALNDETERSEPYSPPRKGFLGRLNIPIHGISDDNEPFSIFGLRCAAPMCGKGSVL